MGGQNLIRGWHVVQQGQAHGLCDEFGESLIADHTQPDQGTDEGAATVGIQGLGFIEIRLGNKPAFNQGVKYSVRQCLWPLLE